MSSLIPFAALALEPDAGDTVGGNLSRPGITDGTHGRTGALGQFGVYDFAVAILGGRDTGSFTGGTDLEEAAVVLTQGATSLEGVNFAKPLFHTDSDHP